MNAAQIAIEETPAITNIAQAEITEFSRNDAQILSFERAAKREEEAAQMREELLPFTVKVVKTSEELAKAVKLRHDAYAKHLPEFAEKLSRPEEADDVDIVLLAESKFDGSALGTMRMKTNDIDPLPVESVFSMPQNMIGKRLTEATRLAIRGTGANRLVRDALFKACFLVCEQTETDHMVIAGRTPVDKIYDWMDFVDVEEENKFYEIPYAANLPHRIMTTDFVTFQERWDEKKHPMYDFIWKTKHKDIKIEVTNWYQTGNISFINSFNYKYA